MYFVYVLKLSNDSFYVGITRNLKRRVKEHQAGLCYTTKKNLPVILISYTAFTNKTKATNYEKYLKSGSGMAFRNKYLV